ncbi:ATP-binding cassette domain-containing protein [Roseomonas sp. CECT 9278]|uniref:ATP-binding cassette domain-containing protein n=1 Tax=Roseomonas sp. CECT 9278 TaxID=2845823 RepID=UPI001E4F9254|nr:ATP-binding cassette domain-containing protein [Roseomonas sp. CECT 9278]CAH0159465.1 ABC transporter ATP-binding/permease protein YojI [Roseomonas sp. CECT 9278]
MALAALLRQHSAQRLARLGVLAGFAGLGNALVMAVASDAVQTGRTDALRLALFLVAILIYCVAEWGSVRGLAREVEGVVHALRMQVFDAIRRAGFASLMRLKPAEAYGAITRDSQSISQAATALSLGARAALLIVFTLLYLLWLSPVEFAALLAMAALIASLVTWRARRDRQALDDAVARERAVLQDVTGLLDGFKEAKTSARRGAAQFAAIAQGSRAAAAARGAVDGRAAAGAVAVQTGVYLSLALLVFGLPLVVQTDAGSRQQTITALLFAAGSVALLVQSIPVLAVADEAARNLAALSARLPAEDAGQGPLPDGPPAISLRDIGFTWRDEAGAALFRVGPVNLEVAAGQIVFIAGGNGSGKTTLLRIAAGLLPPDSGTLFYRGTAIAPDNRQTYRDRVGSVFSDMHLFRRPYGIDPDPAVLAALLRDYGLEGKVSLRADGAWEGLALSGGQRKRLGIVSLLLEAPRIVILDEWAADQDPSFRRHFYEEVLPALRRRGCAVLCATHDDRYFATADCCYILRDGRLDVLAPSPPPTSEEPTE